MSMAPMGRVLRAPYKLSNGLMHCETCSATYSRGGWANGIDLNRNETVPPKYYMTRTIPDNVCPWCEKEEEVL